MSKLDEMVVFVEVVGCGSLTQTSRKLNVSPSTISRQISSLEDRLGARLLNRTTRCVSTTEAGSLFYQSCRRIIADIDNAETSVADLQHELRGSLRVTASAEFARLSLGRLLCEFAESHPKLKLDFSFTDETIDLLAENTDVAIRIANLPDSTMVARKLAPCRRVLCASPTYLDVWGLPRRPEELRNHECIGYAYIGGQGGLRFNVSGDVRVVHPKYRITANSGWMIRELALTGVGIGFVPEFLVTEDLDEGSLVELLPEYIDEDTNIFAVYVSRSNLPSKIRVFVDHLVGGLSVSNQPTH